MKLYSVYTDSHKILKDKWFLGTIQDDWDLDIIHIKGGGDRAGSPKFLNIIAKKLEHVVESIKDNMGEIIVWSDVDIQFFKRCNNIIIDALGKKDIVFQKERMCNDIVNSGFFVMKCNEKTLGFWRHILQSCRDIIKDSSYKKLPFAEQTVMNKVLRNNIVDVKWGLLPDRIWARSCGPHPPLDIVLHHANCAAQVGQKLKQLEEIKKIVTSPTKRQWFGYKRKAKKLVKHLLLGNLYREKPW